MENLEIVWNSLGDFFTHSEPNNRPWNKEISRRLSASDREFPILSPHGINRNLLFSSLWKNFSKSIANKNSDKREAKGYALTWINVAYCIMGITDVLAYLLSEKKPPNVGTKKRDPSLNSLKSLLESCRSLEKIDELNFPGEFRQFYKNFDSDIEAIKKSSFQVNQNLSKMIDNLDRIKNSDNALITNATMGIKFMKYQFFSAFNETEIREIILRAVSDLEKAGYSCLQSKNRLKNLMAQRISDDAFFREGPIRRSKGSNKKIKDGKALEEANKMMKRYPDK